jgi:nicotinamidase-related amidase
MATWDEFLSDQDRAVFTQAGYGTLAGFGKRPVVLVVDVNYNFCGDRPEPILESVKRWPNSCGAVAWDAVAQTQRLLQAARGAGVPVFFSTGGSWGSTDFDRGRWVDKNPRNREEQSSSNGNDVVAQIAPLPHEIVLEKGKPSAFFGTLLTSYLADLGADSLIVCGTTTSGCVRASVVDAFSYNFRVAVVEECTFDRGEASHAIGLFDMHQKYADVVTLAETIEFIEGLPDDLFADRFPALTTVKDSAAATS